MLSVGLIVLIVFVVLIALGIIGGPTMRDFFTFGTSKNSVVGLTRGGKKR
jgi:hypothetical protein